MGAIFSMAFNWGLSLVSGLSLKQWAYIAGALAGAFVLWTAYSWAWDRGAASQAADDAKVIAQAQIKIDALAANVEALVRGIEDANVRIALEQAKRMAAEAEAAARAQADLAGVEVSRRREAERGAGADNMNEFFGEMFTNDH